MPSIYKSWPKIFGNTYFRIDRINFNPQGIVGNHNRMSWNSGKSDWFWYSSHTNKGQYKVGYHPFQGFKGGINHWLLSPIRKLLNCKQRPGRTVIFHIVLERGNDIWISESIYTKNMILWLSLNSLSSASFPRGSYPKFEQAKERKNKKILRFHTLCSELVNYFVKTSQVN